MYPKYLEEAKDGTETGAGGSETTTTTEAATATETTAETTTHATETATTSQATETKVEPKWPDNWRDLYASGDEKKMARLARYASPTAAFDAMIAAQNRISSGELKSAKPKDATPDQLSKWRQDNGIPESPDKYDTTLDGVVIGENDKPIINEFLKNAHNSDLTPNQVKDQLKWFFSERERQAEERYAQDEQITKETVAFLRKEWGPDYPRNINLIEGLLDQGPEGLKDRLLGKRMVDGVPVGADKQMMQWLAHLALQINPISTLVTTSGNSVESISNEIADIEKMMRDRGSDYWKGPKSEKLQERYRLLVAARDKVKAA